MVRYTQESKQDPVRMIRCSQTTAAIATGTKSSDTMAGRRFAPVTVLTDETTILGASVAQWDELLTAGFVEAFPKKPASNDLLNKKALPAKLQNPLDALQPHSNRFDCILGGCVLPPPAKPC